MGHWGAPFQLLGLWQCVVYVYFEGIIANGQPVMMLSKDRLQHQGTRSVDEHLLEIFIREVRLQCQFASAAFDGILRELQQIPARREAQAEKSQRIRDQYRQQIDALLYPAEACILSGDDFHQTYRQLLEQESREVDALTEGGSTWPVFYFSYSFLLHTAIVSKILWPGSKLFPKEKRVVGPENMTSLAELRESRGKTLQEIFEVSDDWKIKNKDLRDDLEHYDERLEAWYISSPQRNSADMNLMPRSAISGLNSMDFRRNLDPSTLFFYIEGNEYDFPGLKRELDLLHDRAIAWLRDNTGPAKWRAISPDVPSE